MHAWIDADEWLNRWEQALGRPLLDVKRPLNFADAAKVAKLTGIHEYAHLSNGRTALLLRDKPSTIQRAI